LLIDIYEYDMSDPKQHEEYFEIFIKKQLPKHFNQSKKNGKVFAIILLVTSTLCFDCGIMV